MSIPQMDDFGCSRCGRLLARVDLSGGSAVEVVCAKCQAFNTLQIRPLDKSGESGIIKSTT